MNEIRLTVHLSTDLHSRARQIAAQRNTTLSEVMRTALENYLEETEPAEAIAQERVENPDDEKMRREKAFFAAQQPVLQRLYPGEFVAVHEGQVIDHDPNLAALHRRVVSVIGATTVLLKHVDEPVNREFVLRRPRLERSV
ncbi:MAG: ribbon-helix-helix protein, CopG family [Caldilineaceae bacterium]|nr:ribbon-helix-helix protein, CopG family [Caldilineaceae bacterium]